MIIVMSSGMSACSGHGHTRTRHGSQPRTRNITVSRVPPGYIIARRCQFVGFGMGRDDELASIVRSDMGHPLQPMLDPRTGLMCG